MDAEAYIASFSTSKNAPEYQKKAVAVKGHRFVKQRDDRGLRAAFVIARRAPAARTRLATHTIEEVEDDRVHDASERLPRAAAEAVEATERVLIETHGRRMAISHWWDSFPSPLGDVVVRVVAGLRAEGPVVPRNARANGVRLGAVAIQKWISGARRQADATAKTAGLVRKKRADNLPNERVPGEGVTSDLTHIVTRQIVAWPDARPGGSRETPRRSR
jgi:hypothetical protein